jgi:hypothetical protein
MIIFVATIQTNNMFIESLKKEDRIILHPFYSFTTDEGKEVLSKLESNPDKYDHYWESVFRKDMFCISHSDLVLYDLDNLPEEGRYLTMAASLRKPIIGISDILKPAPIYFSGSILAVMKPRQVLSMLPFIIESDTFLNLPNIVVEDEDNTDAETILSNP